MGSRKGHGHGSRNHCGTKRFRQFLHVITSHLLLLLALVMQTITPCQSKTGNEGSSHHQPYCYLYKYSVLVDHHQPPQPGAT
jgi:hypothetical protein